MKKSKDGRAIVFAANEDDCYPLAIQKNSAWLVADSRREIKKGDPVVLVPFPQLLRENGFVFDNNTYRNGPPRPNEYQRYTEELGFDRNQCLIMRDIHEFWWGFTEPDWWFPLSEDPSIRIEALERGHESLQRENTALKDAVLRLVEFVTTTNPSEERYRTLIEAVAAIGYTGPPEDGPKPIANPQRRPTMLLTDPSAIGEQRRVTAPEGGLGIMYRGRGIAKLEPGEWIAMAVGKRTWEFVRVPVPASEQSGG